VVIVAAFLALLTNSEIDGCLWTIECTAGPRRLAKVAPSNSGLYVTSISHPTTTLDVKVA
jgi:hypothetical protein